MRAYTALVVTLAGGGPMEFRILGSLEIDDAGQRLPVGGLRERQILAALLLDAGRVVPLPRLVDVAWDEDPPASAVKQARNAVSRLRRLLAADGRPQIITDGPGYRLVLGEARLDAKAAEDLAGRAAAAASEGDRSPSSSTGRPVPPTQAASSASWAASGAFLA